MARSPACMGAAAASKSAARACRNGMTVQPFDDRLFPLADFPRKQVVAHEAKIGKECLALRIAYIRSSTGIEQVQRDPGLVCLGGDVQGGVSHAIRPVRIGARS